MKAYSAALAILLSLLLPAWLNKAQAEGRPLAPSSSTSVSSEASTAQTFRDSQVDKKNPFEKLAQASEKYLPALRIPFRTGARIHWASEGITNYKIQNI
ncbi:hypothetical protein DKX38_001267 [Salix brachista]|uniref:Uncharacterized protein n=1 Tax=Salix brachista TaxID=2182728 RepID=A0A5N5P568_9ROSI|nr:hypothetical protein DKX38_001267 [Salix brachista]